MHTTTNYTLKKPEAADNYNVNDQNQNMDIIDAALTPTADPAQAPTGLSGKLVQWVSWITNRIKAITGTTNWYDTPATTLAAANTHASATSAHSATSAATASRIMMRDSNGRAKVVAPSASDDIARKDTVDAVQAHLDTHTADVVTDADGAHGLKIESGTFTPTLRGGTTAGTNTYSVNSGTYYLIGKLCKFDIAIALTAKDAAMAGGLTITGLPFTSKNVANKYSACLASIIGNVDLDATRNKLTFAIAPNQVAITIFNTGDNVAHLQAQPAIITSTTTLYISGEYEIA